MRFALCAALSSVPVQGARAQLNSTATGCRICHGTGVDDNWCVENCNAVQPNCPSNLCKCSPTPTPKPPSKSDIVGYYSPSWDTGSVGPKGANMGVAFTGWIKPSQATDYSGPPLKGTKWVSVGGGNKNGRFTSSGLKAVTSGLNDGAYHKAGYAGIIFDVEECDAGLASQFSTAIAAAKAKGMKVAVTTSHSAPYGCSDGATLVHSWLKDTNLDFISPQLYTSGAERCPDFEANEHLSWAAWKSSKVKIVPSICDDTQYSVVVQWAKQQGFPALHGFLQWAEVH